MLAIGAAIQVEAELPPLPNASEEIERVTKRFTPGQKEVFTAEHATPQAFLSSHLEQYRYIHIAAHGTKVVLDPMDSAIILSRGSNNSYKLYARDIVELKVPLKAELVTISSCNSAGTLVNDLGGPIGLSSAFLHAGAHQVIAALWKVSDAATPQRMDRFYSDLASGKTPGEALHEAKLIILRSKQHQSPFYWATLQLYSRT
jgi:CHAT domain-containing protein